MNSRRKQRLMVHRERLALALEALDEIVPDNLRVAAALIEKLDPDVGATVAPQLSRYADLIAALRENAPDNGNWTPFVRVAMSDDPVINDRLMTASQTDELWVNNRYQVAFKWVYRKDSDDQSTAFRHLSIKRLDKAPIHDWRDLQRIKTEICGADAEGIEMYPAEDRLVDTSNQYHIWVLPKGERPGLGYDRRCIMEAEDFGVRQRPFSDPALKQEAARTYEQFKDGQLGGMDAVRNYLDARSQQKAHVAQTRKRSSI